MLKRFKEHKIGNKYICIPNNTEVTLIEKDDNMFGACYRVKDEFGTTFTVGRHVMDRDFKLKEE